MAVETLPVKQRLDRPLVASGAVGALLVSLPELIQGNEIGASLLGALAFLVISLVLLIVAFINLRKKYISILMMLLIYCTLLWVFHKVAPDVRTNARWFLEAKNYKRQIQALPEPPSGELRHIEWEGWGFPGAGDTVVYLVFDPTDALLAAASGDKSGRFPGLPCQVVRVRRLEKYWYTALFYTDSEWTHCT